MKIICASSWTITKNHWMIHGQQNVKNQEISFLPSKCSCVLFSKAPNEFRLILVVGNQRWTEGPLGIPVWLQYTIYDGADWIYLTHSRGQESSLPQRAENFWILARWLDSKEGPLSLRMVKLLGENIFFPLIGIIQSLLYITPLKLCNKTDNILIT